MFSLTENSVPLAMDLLDSYQERDASANMEKLNLSLRMTKLNPVT